MNKCCETAKVSQEEIYRIDIDNPSVSTLIVQTVCPVCGTKTEKEKEEG